MPFGGRIVREGRKEREARAEITACHFLILPSSVRESKVVIRFM
jgi:hypothetical protein